MSTTLSLSNHVRHSQVKISPFTSTRTKRATTAFLDKIIHIKLEERQETSNPWDREHYQRNQLMGGLEACAPGDIIILCDCDEILRPSALKAGLANHDERSCTIFEQDLFKFFLNRKEPQKWRGPIMMTYERLSQFCLNAARRMRLSESHLGSLKQFSRHNMILHVVKNAGWHFTSMGGKEALVKKLHSWSHFYDSNIQEFLHNFPEEYKKALAQTERVELDATFPRYILENKTLMHEKGLIDE
jgi:beta-1,4-mannosyl-glycoprotein beta-1,4-N-acetylglucosaminyltransferase